MLNLIQNFFYRLKPAKKLHVEYDIGDKKLPTVVFLHGISARSGVWSEVIDGLKNEKLRIITLDLLGFGESPSPSGCRYKIDDHIKSIRRTLNSLNIEKPYYLVGHSMGSIISARYLRLYENEINSAILFSLPLYIKGESNKALVKRINDVYMKFYNFLIKNRSFTIKNSNRVRKLFNLQTSLIIDEQYWDAFRLSLKNTIMDQDTYNDIRQFRTKIRVIYGAVDQLLVQKNLEMLSIFDNVELEKLPAVGHSINAKYAQIMIERIKQMLAEH